MPAEALKSASVTPVPNIDRFNLPDMDRHAKWFMPRFLSEFPHLNERSAIGFLRGIIYSNEFLFLCQEHSVALAQLMLSGGLGPDPIVWERFVWVEDPTDASQLQAAAFFYPRIVKWAKSMGCSVVHVEERTDVPHELIRGQVGKVSETIQKYVRV